MAPIRGSGERDLIRLNLARQKMLRTIQDNTRSITFALNTFCGNDANELLDYEYKAIINENEEPSVPTKVFNFQNWSLNDNKIINSRDNMPNKIIDNILASLNIDGEERPIKLIARHNPIDYEKLKNMDYLGYYSIVASDGTQSYEETYFEEDQDIQSSDTDHYNFKLKIFHKTAFMYRAMRTAQFITGFFRNPSEDPNLQIGLTDSSFWVDNGRELLENTRCSISDWATAVSKGAARQWTEYTNNFESDLMEMKNNLRLDDDEYWRDVGETYQIEFLKKYYDLWQLYAKVCLRASKYLFKKNETLGHDLGFVLDSTLKK
jgi:hypothetical protein